MKNNKGIVGDIKCSYCNKKYGFDYNNTLEHLKTKHSKEFKENFVSNPKKLKESKNTKLHKILVRLNENRIPYTITQQGLRITEIETQDKELIEFAKKNNPNLK